jgi:hypothetical protein
MFHEQNVIATAEGYQSTSPYSRNGSSHNHSAAYSAIFDTSLVGGYLITASTLPSFLRTAEANGAKRVLVTRDFLEAMSNKHISETNPGGLYFIVFLK